jgi:hypothetical protein
VVQATAASYLISPVALASVAPDPHRFSDRFSAFWLLALAGRMVQEVGKLITGAAAARQKLATFAIDGEITFRSAADRAAFAEELGVAVTRLVDKYHDGGAAAGGAEAANAAAGGGSGGARGRRHRLVVALHPTLKPTPTPKPTRTSSTKPLPAKEQDND